MAGLAQTFGSGAMTNPISEISGAKCILAIGTNTTDAHPVIGWEIKQAARKGAELIVANPREIALVRDASLFLQYRPGTDVALIMGICRLILEENLADKSFIEQRCENFDVFKDSLQAFGLDFVESTTGVAREKLIAAARCIALHKPTSIVYAMGITQHTHGTDNVIALADLAMLTGNVGKPSSGVNPLRGQNNVQGACDMGSLPNVYTGYQSVTDPNIRRKFETAWGVPLSDKTGLTLTEMFDAVIKGELQAIYLMGENPTLSDADIHHVLESFKKLKFLVVQDIFLTETAQLADVVLPAVTFAEKEGTFTNTERRIQRVRQAVTPVGSAQPDWWIVSQLAKRMGARGFDYDNPAEIMVEIARLTPSYGGISYSKLESVCPQWPCPTPDHPGTPILHTERFSRGKGQFLPLQYRPPAETVDTEYPLLLTTGRSIFHYHTGTMTRKVKGLNRLHSGELVEINPQDALKLGIAEGDTVRIISRRGDVTAKARLTQASPEGIAFMTFHFAESPTNTLTQNILDPVSKIPEFKVTAVRVEKVKQEALV